MGHQHLKVEWRYQDVPVNGSIFEVVFLCPCHWVGLRRLGKLLHVMEVSASACHSGWAWKREPSQNYKTGIAFHSTFNVLVGLEEEKFSVILGAQDSGYY